VPPASSIPPRSHTEPSASPGRHAGASDRLTEGKSHEALLEAELRTLRSKLHAVQAELQRVERELERTHEAASLGAMAGMLAHEINNVLTPIGSYAQMALLRPEDGSLTQKALERAASGAERGGRVCESILSIARDLQPPASAPPTPLAGFTGPASGSSASRVARSPAGSNSDRDAHGTAEVDDVGAGCRLGHAWRAALETIETERGGVPTGVEPAFGEDAGPAVAIDVTSLQQVLSNLFLNAQRSVLRRWGGEASDHGGIELAWRVGDDPVSLATFGRCSTWNIDPADLAPRAARWALVELRDNGVGLSDAQRDAILAGPLSGAGIGFGPHRQEGSGHGIGLVVSDQLVRRRHGAIGLGSDASGGAVFGLLLPLVTAGTSEAPAY